MQQRRLLATRQTNQRPREPRNTPYILCRTALVLALVLTIELIGMLDYMAHIMRRIMDASAISGLASIIALERLMIGGVLPAVLPQARCDNSSQRWV